MKAILKLTLAGIFCLEILSPVMLGLMKTNKADSQPVMLYGSYVTNESVAANTNWKDIDFGSQEESYSDSKSLMIKE